MKRNYTKGEWVYKSNGIDVIEVLSERMGLVASMSRFDSFEEQEANARLISAAPDLFEALLKLMEYTKGELDGSDYDYVMNLTGSDKAIKKATEQ